MKKNTPLIVAVVALIIAIAAIFVAFTRKAPPDSGGGDSNLEPRVVALENWQAVAEQQLSDNAASIVELNDSQREDSMQINALNSDVAFLLEQINLIKAKDISLHIDTTWIMSDSISLIAFNDSIYVRTKKR